MNKRSTINGFTLIELLVVISIIGFLSSTVLASTNSARRIARNSYANQTVSQYVLAIKNLYLDNGYFPYVEQTSFPGEKTGCLDQANCYVFNTMRTSEGLLNNEIKKYLPTLSPISNTDMYFGAFKMRGLLYSCGAPVDSIAHTCGVAYLSWPLEGVAQCTVSGAATTNSPNDTYCYLTIQ